MKKLEMKKLLVLALCIFLFVVATAQTTSHIAYSFRKGTTNPTSCNPGDVFFNTATGTFLFCGATNTFTAGIASVGTVGQGGFFPYYGATSTGPAPATGTISASNNQVRGRQFVLPFRLVVAKISIEVTTLIAASVTNVAIYNAAGTTKLIDTSFDSSSTGIKTNSFTAVTLEPGVYWLMHAASDLGVQVRQLSSNSSWDAIMNNSTLRSGVSSLSMSSGVMPATIGVISTASTNYPVMWFER